jgi:hypothetical protein
MCQGLPHGRGLNFSNDSKDGRQLDFPREKCEHFNLQFNETHT